MLLTLLVLVLLSLQLGPAAAQGAGHSSTPNRPGPGGGVVGRTEGVVGREPGRGQDLEKIKKFSH